MQNPPYAPSADAPLAAWMLNFTTLLTASPTTYGLTAGNATTCAAAYAAFQSALDIATTPATRTSVTIAAKDAAKAAARATIFPFATQVSADPAVLPADKVDIGVNVRVTTRTRISVTDVPLEISTESLVPGIVTVRSQNPDTPDSTKRPLGTRGWHIDVEVMNAGNTAVERRFTVLGTRRFAPVPFEPSESGRVANISAYWLGAPWPGGGPNLGAVSNTLTVTVP